MHRKPTSLFAALVAAGLLAGPVAAAEAASGSSTPAGPRAEQAPPAADSAGPLANHPEVAGALALLDLWIGERLLYRDLPGLSIAVVHDQELVWAKGYGFADLETGTPATPRTLYRLGSVTKLFTATAVMQLRDAGALRLDDPVAAHLPWFAVESGFDDAPAITIRHLLTHTSGLPREAAFPYWTDHVFPSREELIEALPGQSAVWGPGDRIKYSNLGIALLGEVVAAASGEPYAEYLRRHLFEPLGMAGTTVAPTEEHHLRRATSYLRRLADGSRETFDYYDTAALAPAANGVSSVEDLARFAMLQFRDGPAGGAQVLAGSTLREMHRPHRLADDWQSGRGLGFAVRRREGETLVFHGGWIGGNRTLLLLAPGRKVAVIVAINADDGDPGEFGYRAYDLLAPAIAAAAAPPEPAAPPRPDPAWDRYLGTYTDPWHWEYEVLVLGGRLVLLEHSYPPADDPGAGVTPLEPVPGAEHTFRMPDGEPLVFELDAAGRVERIRRRYDYLFPVAPAAPGAPPAAPSGER